MDSMMGYDDWKTTEPFDPYCDDDGPEYERDDDVCIHGVGFDEECAEDEDEDGGLE